MCYRHNNRGLLSCPCSVPTHSFLTAKTESSAVSEGYHKQEMAMPETTANTTAYLIGLVLFAFTLLYNYSLVAEQLEDDSEWLFWSRMWLRLAGRWAKSGDHSGQ